MSSGTFLDLSSGTCFTQMDLKCNMNLENRFLSPETVINKGAMHINDTYINNNITHVNIYKTYWCRTQGFSLHVNVKLPLTSPVEDQASSLN